MTPRTEKIWLVIGGVLVIVVIALLFVPMKNVTVKIDLPPPAGGAR